MFMTERSWFIFKLFGMEERDLAWLHKSPSLWLNNMAYMHLQQLMCNMQVVNGAAECAVQDVQAYTHMNRGPGDLDDIILVATDHRGHVAQLHKNNVNVI